MKNSKPSFLTYLLLLLSGGGIIYLLRPMILKGQVAIATGVAFTKYRPLTRNLVNLAKLETGNFSSGLYKQTNNLFAMGVPSVRSKDQDGAIFADGRDFATFKNDIQSVKDFVLYLDYFIKKNPISIKALQNPETFIGWLQSNGYNSSPNFPRNFLAL